MTLAEDRGITVGELIAALAALPADAPVLIQADGASEHLMLVVDTDDMAVPDQRDTEGDVVVLRSGVCAVLSAIELPHLVDDELGELAADIADW